MADAMGFDEFTKRERNRKPRNHHEYTATRKLRRTHFEAIPAISIQPRPFLTIRARRFSRNPLRPRPQNP
jgi:hypothetical protein